jgi:hypothetical protein
MRLMAQTGHRRKTFVASRLKSRYVRGDAVLDTALIGHK